MMKKILVLLVLFALPLVAQNRIVVLDFGTIVEATAETQYLSLVGWSKIDSISIIAIASNEVDVDSIDIYKSFLDPGGLGRWVGGIVATATVTINQADATETIEQLYTANATILKGANLRGLNELKVVVQPTAGCDAGDPNRFMVAFQFWGTK